MDRSTAKKILTLLDRFRDGEDYEALIAEYTACDEKLTQLLSRLSREDQMIILDYLWVGLDVHMHMLELSFEMNKKQK